jgi:predicted secreted Zn-dependent protease
MAEQWQQSSYCGNGSCVQVYRDPRSRLVYVRSSAEPDREPLAFTDAEWAAFVAGVKAGEFRWAS